MNTKLLFENWRKVVKENIQTDISSLIDEDVALFRGSDNDKRIYALVEARVRARIKRGIAKRMVTREENAILRDYPRTISKLKLMVRAIREGMAYRSIA